MLYSLGLRPVNSSAIGFVDFRTCSLVHRVQDQNARRIAALGRYIEGWAEANVEKIFNATAPSYRFSDPLGPFRARRWTSISIFCMTGSPRQDRLQRMSFISF
jgi:hypothetical protein